MRRLLGRRLGVVAALALLAGAARAEIPAGSTYVALGSSYAAGTSLPREAADGVPKCGQGAESYPRQVARALKLKLIDRSCGGATVPHLLTGGQFDLPAQVAGVTADTKLVTITIGGNDVRFVADLGLQSCLRKRPESCVAAPPGFYLDRAFATLEGNLTALVGAIRQKAPQARIVFVDYITVLPPEGTCAALGIGVEDAAELRARARRLAELTAKVAAEGKAEVVKASVLSQGHDVCADQPWAWGYISPEQRARTGEAGFHPRPEGIAAVAKAVIERLKS